MGRTLKTVADRRSQLLQAALRVFADKGFDRATNKDIARAAGITPGLIYHYFKSKRDLLLKAMEAHSPLKVFRSVTPSMLTLTPKAFLTSTLREVLAILESAEFVALVRVFLPEAMRKGAIAPPVFAAMGEATSFLEHYFKTKMKTGELAPMDAALTSHLLLGGLMDLVLRRQVIRDHAVLKFSQDQIVDNLVSVTLEGLRPR
ncbi:MAG TPA: TetR/AcrR family transcriptional regulator [Spirochaetia bacterium]|nr:TetR/AcrR family transcriptional regulator [Spirochaetia bacterium]